MRNIHTHTSGSVIWAHILWVFWRKTLCSYFFCSVSLMSLAVISPCPAPLWLITSPSQLPPRSACISSSGVMPAPSHRLPCLSVCSEEKLPLATGAPCWWSPLLPSAPLHGAAPLLCTQELWEAELISVDGIILKGARWFM